MTAAVALAVGGHVDVNLSREKNRRQIIEAAWIEGSWFPSLRTTPRDWGRGVGIAGSVGVDHTFVERDCEENWAQFESANPWYFAAQEVAGKVPFSFRMV